MCQIEDLDEDEWTRAEAIGVPLLSCDYFIKCVEKKKQLTDDNFIYSVFVSCIVLIITGG